MKIMIFGYSGSGKSTLAKFLSNTYQIPVLYMDRVKFKANWQERDEAEARALVYDFMQQDHWVIDGNYEMYYQKERAQQADEIIFMNFSRLACLFRALRRYFTYRNQTRESMADGCLEKIDLDFIYWILFGGRTRKRQNHFNSIVSQYPAKARVLHNQKELDAYYQEVGERTKKVQMN